jgi:hypothetical protein
MSAVRQNIRFRGLSTLRVTTALAAASLLWPVQSSLASELETEPRLPAAEIAPRNVALSGPHHRVLSPVPVAGFMGDYTVKTDWGDLSASGGAILKIRVAEMSSIAKLEEISGTKVFADSVAASAKRTGESIARVVTQPVETVKGIPAGVGRLFKRAARTASRIATDVGDAIDDSNESSSSSAGGQPAGQTAQATDFLKEFAGVNRARRDIARALGIDPYSGNPLLQKRLEELAYLSVAGGMSFGMALGQVGGLAQDVISVTGDLDDLVWDASPAEIRDQLEARLVARGNDARLARDFLRTPAFTPSIQVEFVSALEALGRPSGEPGVLSLATRVRSEVHARFLVNQLRMLKRDGFASDPVTALVGLDQSVAATTRGGRWFVALPVDRLSWSGAIVDFSASGDDLPAVRKVVVSGSVSDRSRTELMRQGFTVVAGVGLP